MALCENIRKYETIIRLLYENYMSVMRGYINSHNPQTVGFKRLI